MLQLNHFGYSNEAECLELVTMFACIEEDDLREKVLQRRQSPRHEDWGTRHPG